MMMWVFIDDQLVLDVGGARAKAEGLLEFGADKDGDNTVTSYVSKIKDSNNQNYDPLGSDSKRVTFRDTPYEFYWKSKKTDDAPPRTPSTPLPCTTWSAVWGVQHGGGVQLPGS